MYLPKCVSLLAAAGLAGVCLAQAPPASPAGAPPAPLPVAPPMVRTGFYEAPVGRMADFLYSTIQTHKADLNVTDAQMASIDTLRTSYLTERQARFSAREAARREMQEAANADPIDMAKFEAKVAAYGKTTTDDFIADVKLRDAIRKVLTADQRAKLKDMRPEFPGMPTMPRPPMTVPAAPPAAPAPLAPPAPPAS